MEISAASFRHLLRNISKAVGVKESATDYDDLLREIFEEKAPYEMALADSENENFPSEKVFGRDYEKKMLLSKLINPDEKLIQLSVIPIIGASGIGKTTLARLVYEDEAVKEHFDVLGWVKVDGHELKLKDAAQGILKSAIDMSCSLDDMNELDEMVRDTLQWQRFLIVFDGIESMAKDSWLHMNQYWFNFVDMGSKVLITSTSKVVAKLVAKEAYALTKLSLDFSLSMCRYLAFGSSEGIGNMSSPMVENISALCQGIPLSLKLLVSFMGYDDKLRNLLSSVNFSDGILLPPSDASVVILLCVWGLPPHLRRCLAYCAIFPKGLALSKKKIIDMWIARGLVKPFPGNDSLHDIADSYFHQLLCRSFFTDITHNQYGEVIEFRIPGLIHKMVEDIARIVYEEKLGLIESISEDAGQLSLVLPFAGKYNSEQTQTLILSPIIYLGGSLDHSILDFQELRSLDLSCSDIQNLSDDICVVKELRYLNLSYTRIERLPDSITDLSQLQTLDLTGCYHLQVLPKEMRNLMHMRHLDFWLCDSLSYLPSGISFLKSLTSMTLFVLGKGHDCARLGELGHLNQLRGRLEIRNLENVWEISEARDAKIDQKNLHNLGLSWNQNADNCFMVLELLQPNPHLKVFDLTGYTGFQIPRWISSSNNLIKISITNCGCKELPSLGQLPFLKELQLKGMTNLERIGPELYGDGNSDLSFPSLEQLGLYDLPSLLEWSGAILRGVSPGISAISVLSSLKTLTIEGCPQLQSLPSLPTLPDLIVWNSCKSIISSLTSFKTLSSLLINDIELGASFGDLGRLDSLKKLILCNIKDKHINNVLHRPDKRFTALEHLGILHCDKLTELVLCNLSLLQKLHIVDCPNVIGIHVNEVKDTLVELVVEDCPRSFADISFHEFCSLRKLILKNCGGRFTMYNAGEYRKLEKLEYMSISGCPEIERDLENFPSLVSHIPCIIVGNHKADFKDIKDLNEVTISASYEPKSEMKVLFRHSFSHGSQKSTTEQSIGSELEQFSSYKNSDLTDDDSSSTKTEPMSSISLKGEFKRVISKWQKGMLLGHGSLGSVYEGVADDGFLFAVKEISLLDQGDQGMQRIIQLEQEIDFLSQFEHENIVRYYGTQKDGLHLYILLELGTLGSLLSLYQKYKLPESVVSCYTRQILHGLKYLHRRNVVHRDIKCANILVDANGSVKLADFGLAKAYKLNDGKSLKGMSFWTAPEVVRSKGHGFAVDIWSLGCTVLEMLTRQFPYSNLECIQALFRIGRGERPHIPDTLSSNSRDFILTCLQVDPSLRPTAAQLLDHPFVKFCQADLSFLSKSSV